MGTPPNHIHRYRPRKITRRKTEHGQSFIEFALILPALFFMLLGATVIAQGVNMQLVLYGAAYDGARIWAKNPIGGDSSHCSPPACDPSAGTSKNFEKYIVPAVRQYVTNNGYDGSKVIFFDENNDKAQEILNGLDNNRRIVTVTLLYPYDLPVGNLAAGFQRILIHASCSIKRGA